jgi:hypothetical protein
MFGYGDGMLAIHTQSAEWAERFRNGEPDYQTDEKWYEAARLHDELKARATAAGATGPVAIYGATWPAQEDPKGADQEGT